MVKVENCWNSFKNFTKSVQLAISTKSAGDQPSHPSFPALADVPQYVVPDIPFRLPEVAWSELLQSGDAVIIVGGRVTRLARQSPFLQTLEQITRFQNSVTLESPDAQLSIQQAAINQIASITRDQLQNLQSYISPAQAPATAPAPSGRAPLAPIMDRGLPKRK